MMELSNLKELSLNLLLFILVVILIDLIIKRVVVARLKKNTHRLKKSVEESIKKNNFFPKMRHFILITLAYFALPMFLNAEADGFLLTQKIVSILFLLALVRFMTAGFNLLNRAIPTVDGVATKGIFQILKILTFILGIVLLISVLLGQNPITIVAGLAGLTAIMMLIFKDSILGFVAGLQIAMNDMLKLGDWIEVPDQGADGTVIDISLTTIKVQNWDNTIVSIPAYSLVTSGFKNWEGMSKSGVRRVARSVNIDINSIKFIDENTMSQLKKIDLLKPYLAKKEKELAKYNKDKNVK
ncbi:MAG: mechanosensitive ion channel, partial [Elusimicrobiaceae bacterium]|nr:mechanosensitive ion channel [Elusimicrobiaceae bacterium]